jgi:hypothetical protein
VSHSVTRWGCLVTYSATVAWKGLCPTESKSLVRATKPLPTFCITLLLHATFTILFTTELVAPFAFRFSDSFCRGRASTFQFIWRLERGTYWCWSMHWKIEDRISFSSRLRTERPTRSPIHTLPWCVLRRWTAHRTNLPVLPRCQCAELQFSMT